MPTTKPKPAKQSVRLPGHVVPSRYSIFLHPDLESHTFRGEETVTLSLAKPVSEITLHSADLAIARAAIRFGKETLEAAKVSYDTKAETATFHFAKRIPKGNAKLELAFSGVLADNMRGFYKSRYVVDGKERFMATTQFEATDARRAFPCFDEPAQKAVFEVKLAVAPDKTAISNTLPSEIAEHEAGYKIISFEPTPKMSTYLLAFIVGDFEWIEAKTKRGVLVRVFTVPGRKEQGRFSLECAVRCLDFYEEYFAINYPLPVLDMIAVPDFASGAMENWGAVTYRDTILIDEHASLANRQWIAIVVAHELAHQWFGNLVTMEWWTDLWLNEGFASYIEYLATDTLFPEWNIWSQFLLNDHGPALRLDALMHTHPIEVDVHHPNEIGEIFDEVSYSKGASVIRMLAAYIGEKNFRDGLRHYLKTHSYKNTQTTDLWESFEKVSKLPVKKMMQNWTRTPGYPLVTLSEKGAKVTARQERFFMSPLSAKKAQSTQRWMVPIAAATERGTSKPALMNGAKLEIENGKEWLKANAGESGVYRVHYEGALLGKLVEPIATKMLPPVDRLGVIRDLFALAEAGKADTSTALDLLAAYREEDEFIVWGELLSGLGKIARLFGEGTQGKALRAFALSIVQTKAEEIGWQKRKGETDDTTFLRSSLLAAAGRYGHKQTIATARELFAARERTPIHGDIRGVVYSLVAENGGEAEWNAFADMYKAAKTSEEKNRIGRVGLGGFKSTKLLQKTLAFSLSEHVRSQDAPAMIAGVLANESGTKLAWQFMQKNWKELHTRYSSGGHMLPRLIAPLAFFADVAQAKEVVQFFKKNPAPGAERTIRQVEEKILSNAAWKRRDGKKIEKWLKG